MSNEAGADSGLQSTLEGQSLSDKITSDQWALDLSTRALIFTTASSKARILKRFRQTGRTRIVNDMTDRSHSPSKFSATPMFPRFPGL